MGFLKNFKYQVVRGKKVNFLSSRLEGGPRRVNHAAVAIGDKIYSFGGYCTGEDYETTRPIDVHVFDTITLVPRVHVLIPDSFSRVSDLTWDFMNLALIRILMNTLFVVNLGIVGA